MGLFRSYYKLKMAKKAFDWVMRKVRSNGKAKGRGRRGVRV